MANSVYGVSGAKRASPCQSQAVAESTTAIGRQMILRTSIAVQERFAQHKPKVIYGDTDSVMVLLRVSDDHEAWEVARAMAHHVTNDVFGNKQELEAECLKRCMSLFGKKRYLALECEDEGTALYKQVEKGVASVRRDKPEVLLTLLRQLYAASTKLGHFPLATIRLVMARICCAHFEAMVANQFEVPMYAITCRLNNMTAPSAQMVAAKMLQELTGAPPVKGDAIAFVHVNSSAKLATHRVAPVAALDKLPHKKVDRLYYFLNKVWPIVQTTLEVYLPKPTILGLRNAYERPMQDAKQRTLSCLQPGAGNPGSLRRRRVEDSLAHVAGVSSRVAQQPPAKRRKLTLAQKQKNKQRMLSLFANAGCDK